MQNPFRYIKPFVSKHEPEILMGMGISGLIFSTVWAVRATFKASKAIRDYKESKQIEKITPKETFKLTWRYYWPVAASTLLSVPCVIAGNNNSNNSIYFECQSSNGYVVGDTIQVKYWNKFDLTLMGLDSITTVEEFNHIFPLTYYPYNAGEIKNTVIKGVKVNGANLCDKITLSGYSYVADYLKYNDNNSMFVKANITYTFYSPTEAFYLQAYSSKNNNSYLLIENALSVVDLNVLSAYCWDGRGLQTIPTVRKLTFTPKVDCYITICGLTKTLETPTLVIGTTALINYKPYKEPRIINIPQTNLLSAGTVHDTIKFVEGNIVAGQQRYDMVGVSRINSVDLGTLNWAYSSTTNRFSVLLSGAKPSTNNETKANIICSLYQSATYTETLSVDKTIAIDLSNYLYVKDSAYTDPTAFKTAMSGVILNYEKNEYTETTLATDLTFEEVSAIIEQGGSIETVFEIVPPNLKTAFVVNKAIVS